MWINWNWYSFRPLFGGPCTRRGALGRCYTGCLQSIAVKPYFRKAGRWPQGVKVKIRTYEKNDRYQHAPYPGLLSCVAVIDLDRHGFKIRFPMDQSSSSPSSRSGLRSRVRWRDCSCRQSSIFRGSPLSRISGTRTPRHSAGRE